MHLDKLYDRQNGHAGIEFASLSKEDADSTLTRTPITVRMCVEWVSESAWNPHISRINYSDRYIQNPAVITILGTLFKFLKGRIAADAQLQVSTLFKSGKLQGRKAFDDWARQDDFEFFVSNWLSAMAGQAVNLVVETSNRDVPHRRRLDLEFEDGRSLRVRFDQGIAYWQVRFGSHADMWFDFDIEAQDQLMHMAKVVETAKVQNSEQKWSTDVLVELVGK